jgi:hypothetical protein
MIFNFPIPCIDEVLRAVLALYMPGPLPTLEEVLICKSTTTAEEVALLQSNFCLDYALIKQLCHMHAG